MVPESEIKAEVHRIGHRTADMIIALCALFISLCSLGLAIHQGYAMDRLVEANSRPVLTFSSGDQELAAPPGQQQGVLYFSLENPGAGTARIEWFTIRIEGHVVHGWRDALRYIRASAISRGTVASSVPLSGVVTTSVAPSYLKWGDSRRVLVWPRTPKNASLWDVVDQVRQSGAFHITACYCSIFNECWIVDSRVTWPFPVKTCAAGKAAGQQAATSE